MDRGAALELQCVCAWALHSFGKKLDSAGIFLTDEQADELVDVGKLFLECYARLAADALALSRPRWKLRPKFHSLHCETILRMASGSRANPRYFSCWLDEDYIGRMCNLGKAASSHPTTMSRRVMERMMLSTNCWLVERRQ